MMTFRWCFSAIAAMYLLSLQGKKSVSNHFITFLNKIFVPVQLESPSPLELWQCDVALVCGHEGSVPRTLLTFTVVGRHLGDDRSHLKRG